jgi:hypothetical protein
MVQKARYVASGQKMYKERATVGVVVVGKGSQRKHTANGKKKSGCLGRGSVVMTGARVFKKQVCESQRRRCRGPRKTATGRTFPMPLIVQHEQMSQGGL